MDVDVPRLGGQELYFNSSYLEYNQEMLAIPVLSIISVRYSLILVCLLKVSLATACACQSEMVF